MFLAALGAAPNRQLARVNGIEKLIVLAVLGTAHSRQLARVEEANT